jgi:hypothetical protein
MTEVKLNIVFGSQCVDDHHARIDKPEAMTASVDVIEYLLIAGISQMRAKLIDG